eukprot:TRINITY_DN59366_c0_g1_i1.p1 TRINITY_DN59366_c0_g1~~TRINITY_DN59366_c0_g1_i1.p1  ORF type:complete len:160 (+),score=28.19 TRINITY_DN59366_c0_g1_i1:41-481(+)
MSDYGESDAEAASVPSGGGEDVDDGEDAAFQDAPDDEEPADGLYGMKKARADDHITLNIMTRFELARVIGVRAQQLSLGAQSFLAVTEIAGLDDPVAIATMEVWKRKLPMVIRRYLPNGVFEDVPLQDLVLPLNWVPPGLVLQDQQ